MRPVPVLLAILLLTIGARSVAEPAGCNASARHALLLHGGYLDEHDVVTPAQRTLLARLLESGDAALADGGSALDSVVTAIAAMEDSGLLDAGKGSIVNTAGFTETDASLMDGATGRSGAVAAMQRIRNPIRAARLVMDHTPHVLFAGTTGESTLTGLGAETIDPAAYYHVAALSRPPSPARRHGTVGAAALDRCGRLAAGTSTGGWEGKLPGRIGDSPIIGASTWADDRVALSATGVGEYFIKRTATRDIALRNRFLGESLETAARHVVLELIGKQDKAPGAIIALDAHGAIVVVSNGFGVLWGMAGSEQALHVDTRAPR